MDRRTSPGAIHLNTSESSTSRPKNDKLHWNVQGVVAAAAMMMLRRSLRVHRSGAGEAKTLL
jgi:hypothetical protein